MLDRVCSSPLRFVAAGLVLLSSFCASIAQSTELPDLIQVIKPSVVVVGTYSKTRSPAFSMRGTGFVVGNGNQIATNAHVLPEIIASANGESLAVQTSASELRLASTISATASPFAAMSCAIASCTSLIRLISSRTS